VAQPLRSSTVASPLLIIFLSGFHFFPPNHFFLIPSVPPSTTALFSRLPSVAGPFEFPLIIPLCSRNPFECTWCVLRTHPVDRPNDTSLLWNRRFRCISSTAPTFLLHLTGRTTGTTIDHACEHEIGVPSNLPPIRPQTPHSYSYISPFLVWIEGPTLFPSHLSHCELGYSRPFFSYLTPF